MLRLAMAFFMLFTVINAQAAGEVVFVTHSSLKWDGQLRVRSAIEALLRRARGKNYRIVNLEDTVQSGATPQNWFIGGVGTTERVFSETGAHRLSTSGSRIIAAGGNFSACLCRTVRDGLRFSPRVGRVDVVMEATYDGIETLTEMFKDSTDQQVINHVRFLFFDEPSARLCVTDGTGSRFKLKVFRNDRFIGEVGPSDARVVEIRFVSLDQI